MRNTVTGLFTILAIVVLISSCSKNNGSNGGSSGVVRPDTLTTGWTKVTGLPNENFTDIFFADNSNGYTVSNNGIYKSTDGGDTWTKITSTSTVNLTSVAAGTSNNAVFTAGHYDAYVTQDAGTNFAESNYPYPGGGPVNFFDCFFSSASTCYYSSRRYIWKSVDAGVTIDTIYKFSGLSETSSLFFLDDLQGWVIRQDGLYQTTDGGINWNVDTALVNAYGDVNFIDLNNGYYSNYGIINKTNDAGVTWTQVYQSPFTVYLDLDFIDTNEGYFTENNRIYKTTDAGNNWTNVVAMGNEMISRICFTDVNHGWACTSDGVIVKYVQ